VSDAELLSEADVARLRRDEFAWMDKQDVVYMNAASTGPSPSRSIEAQIDFVRRRAMPHLVDFDDQFGTLDRCRMLIAQLVGAHEDEIGLTTNTGAGINLAAWGLLLAPGDEVVVPGGEFPANMYPWLAASRARGFEVHVVPLRDGLPSMESLLSAIERPGVRVLAVSWVGFSSGARLDLDILGTACRDRGIHFVVDAIQGLGALTVDVSQCPIDILACGGQKWLLSPWGTGFVYVRQGMMESLEPQPVSWMAVRDSDDFSRLVQYDLTWRPNARRFEQVTLAYQDFAGMAASLELLVETGARKVAEHLQRCAHELLEGASARGMSLVTPIDYHAGVASVRPTNARAVSAQLTNANIIHSVREGTIRLAPHCYTTDADIARTLKALTT
jgi:cysteine desulfurase/selenocysteine lyase